MGLKVVILILFTSCSDYTLSSGKDDAEVPDTDVPTETMDTDIPTGSKETDPPDGDTFEGVTDTGCSVDLATWDLSARWERSAMSDRVQVEEIGTCVSAALSLPTTQKIVWDDGTYTPADMTKLALAQGHQWASWDQLGEVDCHRFTLSLKLPRCDWSALHLSSPWFDGVAINDNLYIVFDGTTVWTGGTDYGLINGQGPAETGGWATDGIIELPAALLDSGSVDLEFIAEEREEWGGFGFIEAELAP